MLIWSSHPSTSLAVFWVSPLMSKAKRFPNKFFRLTFFATNSEKKKKMRVVANKQLPLFTNLYVSEQSYESRNLSKWHGTSLVTTSKHLSAQRKKLRARKCSSVLPTWALVPAGEPRKLIRCWERRFSRGRTDSFRGIDNDARDGDFTR